MTEGTGVSRLVADAPRTSTTVPDAEAVTAFWQGLGLPGLFDAHAHFLPANIQRAVWAQFDNAGPKIGREWPIRYRGSVEERVAQLRSFGVRRFPTLPYAHKPGVATYLNGWAREFAADVPESLWSGTFFPEPEAAAYVEELVGDGVEMFKLHLQVGEFHLDDPLLDEVWGVLEDSGTPVMAHAGSGPVGTPFTGPESMARLLSRYPDLAIVVAHMGIPECAEFLQLAERYPKVRLDTSMAFTSFFAEHGGYPSDLVPHLRDLQHKVLFGSDFPTLPFPYADQLDDLSRLDLGDDWLRAVCWENGVRLFGAAP